jgi:hypothetical protein
VCGREVGFFKTIIGAVMDEAGDRSIAHLSMAAQDSGGCCSLNGVWARASLSGEADDSGPESSGGWLAGLDAYCG